MKRGAVLFFVLPLVMATTTAFAAPSARLIYALSPGTESCPDETALKRAVAARIGYDVFFPWATTTVVVRFSHDDKKDAFVASVELVDADAHSHGARELRASSCASLLDAAALTISIAIDPQSLAGPVHHPPVDPPPTPPNDPPVTPPAVTPPVASPPIRAPEPTLPTPTSWTLSLGLGATAGWGPGLGLGGGAEVDVQHGWWSLGLEGRLDAPTSTAAIGGGRVGAWLARGGLAPCAHVGPAYFCGIAELGSMSSSSSGVANERSASTLWLAAGGRIGVQILTTHALIMRLHTDVLGDLRRATLRLNGLDTWTAPPLSTTLGIDIGLRFL